MGVIKIFFDLFSTTGMNVYGVGFGHFLTPRINPLGEGSKGYCMFIKSGGDKEFSDLSSTTSMQGWGVVLDSFILGETVI